MSFLVGALTLMGSTLLYVLLWQVEAAFWAWAVVSVLLGLGFTFFSGAMEAWLVDALHHTGYTGELDAVFGRAQAVQGAAMLVGSVLGGVHRAGDQPGGAVRRPGGAARADLRAGLLPDARHRLHARCGARGRARRCAGSSASR